MLSEHAEFMSLHFKNMVTASDGTKKVNMSFACLATHFCMVILCIRMHMYYFRALQQF